MRAIGVLPPPPQRRVACSNADIATDQPYGRRKVAAPRTGQMSVIPPSPQKQTVGRKEAERDKSNCT